MRQGKREAFLLAMFLAGALGSCARNPSSATLSLSLRPGMERTLRFVTEQRLVGMPRGAATAGSAGLPSPYSPSSYSISLTYRFRVTSVDAGGLAHIESQLLEASAPEGGPSVHDYIESLKQKRSALTIDRRGQILAIESDEPSPFQITGLPLAPGAATQQTPAQGDLGMFFNGLNGRKVALGETWTSQLPQSSGSSGLRGTLHWTLASISGAAARLSYTGKLEDQELQLPGLASGRRARLTGDASGFVELETDTGWPVQGKSVLRVDVSTIEANSGTGVTMLSLSIITLFDPAQ